MGKNKLKFFLTNTNSKKTEKEEVAARNFQKTPASSNVRRLFQSPAPLPINRA